MEPVLPTHIAIVPLPDCSATRAADSVIAAVTATRLGARTRTTAPLIHSVKR